ETQSSVELGNYGTPAPKIESPPAPDPPLSLTAGKTMKPRGHTQKPRGPRAATLLVYEWRSPTLSLLRTPGEQLLKTVPRLDESLIEIGPMVPSQQDQRN